VVQLEALLTVWEPVPELAQQMLSNMLTTTRVGLDETRRALSALRATPLEELGLALAVRTLAEDFGTRHALEMDIDIPEDLDDIPPDVEQSFYRISQEALANIAQHARASSVAIRMDRVNHGLELLISDDGTGFRLDGGKRENQRKFGIQGMYERADAIGADLEIIKQPGNGTLITLFWGSQQ
jgi:two-component system sensor histidine kinase UhpB